MCIYEIRKKGVVVKTVQFSLNRIRIEAIYLSALYFRFKMKKGLQVHSCILWLIWQAYASSGPIRSKKPVALQAHEEVLLCQQPLRKRLHWFFRVKYCFGMKDLPFANCHTKEIFKGQSRG